MTRRRARLALAGAAALVGALEACTLLAPLGDHAGENGAAGDGSSGDDGNGTGGDDGGKDDGASPDGGPAPLPGALAGVIDGTFVDHALEIGGASSGAGVELVSVASDDQDRLYGLADVHTTPTSHTWHVFVLSPDGAVIADRELGSGTPFDGAYDATTHRVYGVGIVNGLGSVEYVDVQTFATGAVGTGDPGFRVVIADRSLYVAKLSASTGVVLLRYDLGLRPFGLANDAGGALAISGKASSATPTPMLTVLGGDAYVLGDVNGPVGTPPIFGAVVVHGDGTASPLAPFVATNMVAPADVVTMGDASVAGAGVVEAGAGLVAAAARVLPDGGADPTYAPDLSALDARGVRPSRLVVGADARLYVVGTPAATADGGAGTSQPVAAVSRLGFGGALDTSFGAGGVLLVPHASAGAPQVRAACLQRSRNRLVVVGATAPGTNGAQPFVAAIK